ncbi:patatin-like phospholipase family protein [Dokdonella immobilis]|uniref:NTE family protein n=1 Tax=Dokdonella immobilis TaxID=578942 RepID=A0A1I4YB77_9GAMM|nr:patatin-like phospholipase family protein [Dokdonella immobilis]SFN34993.1 NTE family protein [Dokdonella immobilis]
MRFRRTGSPPEDSAAGIGLALQGGGAHGAFTWGVLDRLLEQPDIRFERISGTSSGAINALALAQGWMDGGAEGARACLDSVWTRIAGHTHAAAWIFGTQSKVGQKTAQSLHRYFTPRQINPLGFNPVRQIAEASFDFERLRERAPFPLHLAATRVRDGALVMFGPEQLSIDALLASTCLPQMFAPVTIDGEVYWDGGWAGNPVLEPLIYAGRSRIIIVVLVQPLNRPDVPSTPAKIAERMSELGFSSAFLRELRTLAFAQNSLDGALPRTWLGQRIRDTRIHLIEPGEPLDAFRTRSHFETSMSFLAALREHGRRRAEMWIGNPDAHIVTGELPLLRSAPP